MHCGALTINEKTGKQLVHSGRVPPEFGENILLKTALWALLRSCTLEKMARRMWTPRNDLGRLQCGILISIVSAWLRLGGEILQLKMFFATDLLIP